MDVPKNKELTAKEVEMRITALENRIEENLRVIELLQKELYIARLQTAMSEGCGYEH